MLQRGRREGKGGFREVNKPKLGHTPMQVQDAIQQHGIYSEVLVHAADLRSMKGVESNKKNPHKKCVKKQWYRVKVNYFISTLKRYKNRP